MHKTFVDRADLARRIQAAGVPIHTVTDCINCASTAGVFVRQHGGETESTVFDYYGGTSFII